MDSAPFQPYPFCDCVESVNVVLTAVGHRGRGQNHEGQTVCLWSLAGVTAKQTPWRQQHSQPTPHALTPATIPCQALLWLLPRLQFLLLLAALTLAFPLQCYSRERETKERFHGGIECIAEIYYCYHIFLWQSPDWGLGPL